MIKDFVFEKEPARQPEKAYQQIENQWRKTGDSIFKIDEIEIAFEQAWFFPISILNEWRRESLEELKIKRLDTYQRKPALERTYPPFPLQTLNYTGNVTNQLAKKFYEKCGVKEIAPGFEIKAEKGVPLMFTKHCLRYSMGWCPTYQKKRSPYREPYYLLYKDKRLKLSFDCRHCQMLVLEDV